MKKVYTARNYKIALLGKQVDPIPKLDGLMASDLSILSQNALMKSLSNIIRSLNDWHLMFQFPINQACLMFDTGLRWTYGPENQVIVSSFNQSIQQALLKIAQMQKGDELLEWNGKDIRDYLKEESWQFYRAPRRALQFLSRRQGLLYPVPLNDTFSIKIKQFKTNAIISATLPWIVEAQETCLRDQVVQGPVLTAQSSKP